MLAKTGLGTDPRSDANDLFGSSEKSIELFRRFGGDGDWYAHLAEEMRSSQT